MSQKPLEPADPSWAQAQLPPLPETTNGTAALSESAELVGFLEIQPQMGWNNTQIEINLSPMSVLIGMVLGCILTIVFRG
ncbi:hypothetical protein [Halomicronema sp. CCY15110]|uniref:hypothetical protein n=1 Tax=Halomicronema sp. CCY15110 TaxID=2767773 RepID=UPI0019514A4A|nr:hypothetical protein [Halomicronema sp. CCY15110]